MPLYGLRHLPHHLHQVNRAHDARTVLLDFEFLRTKLEATDANGLIADYGYFPKEADLWLVQSALQLSAHVLAHDQRQLAGQLTGRLLGSALPSIQALLQQAAERNPGVWLRPLTPSLTQPGGPLIRTLEGHMGWVTSVAVTPDGQRVVSASHDRTLRVWDLETGHQLRKLEGHAGWVHAVAVTPDSHHGISGSGDQTLRVWDLESGQTLRTLEGHMDWITAVAVTPDRRRVVSASRDRTLRLWDLESGEKIAAFTGESGMTSCAVGPDGRTIIAGDESGQVHFLELIGAD
jgi:WD40 repeat protein